MALPDITTMYHGVFPRRVPYMVQGRYASGSVFDTSVTPGTDNAVLIERLEWVATSDFSVTSPLILTPMLPEATGLNFIDLKALLAASTGLNTANLTSETLLKGTLAFRPPVVLRDSENETLTLLTDSTCTVTGVLAVTFCGWILPESDLGDIFE